MATMKQWAVGEEVLAADFQKFLQNQVVPVFASAAVRDSEWPAPPAGAMCMLTDSGTLWKRVGSAWKCDMPLGRLGYVSRTTDGPSNAANVEGIVLTLAVTVPPNIGTRSFHVMAGWRASVGIAGEFLTAKIREGTTIGGVQVADLNSNMAPSGMQASSAGGTVIHAFYTGASWTSKSFVLTTQSSPGGASRLLGLANSPIWMAVYDEGPS